jgi:hypothetical protein
VLQGTWHSKIPGLIVFLTGHRATTVRKKPITRRKGRYQRANWVLAVCMVQKSDRRGQEREPQRPLEHLTSPAGTQYGTLPRGVNFFFFKVFDKCAKQSRTEQRILIKNGLEPIKAVMMLQ